MPPARSVVIPSVMVNVVGHASIASAVLPSSAPMPATAATTPNRKTRVDERSRNDQRRPLTASETAKIAPMNAPSVPKSIAPAVVSSNDVPSISTREGRRVVITEPNANPNTDQGIANKMEVPTTPRRTLKRLIDGGGICPTRD